MLRTPRTRPSDAPMHDTTTTLRPPGHAPPSAGRVDEVPVRPRGGASLAVACLLLGIVILGGMILRIAPGPNVVDTWGFSAFPNVLHNDFLHLMSDLGLAPVTAGVALLAGISTWRRDRRRTFACLAGPGLAVGLAELLKLAVDRRFHGALCWPSGTTAAVTAVVTGVVLVTRGRGRLVALLLGSAVVAFEVVALVAFRWHYLSDALGGVVLGVGCVLLADALLHRIRRPVRRRGRFRRPVARNA